jgi:hypothetical protein
MVKISKEVFSRKRKKIRQPLGDWDKVDTGWEWLFSPQDRNLYKITETGWLQYPPTKIRQHLPIYSHRGTVTVTPTSMEVATRHAYIHGGSHSVSTTSLMDLNRDRSYNIKRYTTCPELCQLFRTKYNSRALVF